MITDFDWLEILCLFLVSFKFQAKTDGAQLCSIPASTPPVISLQVHRSVEYPVLILLLILESYQHIFCLSFLSI